MTFFFDNSIIIKIVGMVEKLNSTVISALKACTTTPTDWVDCLQSVAMSIRSQPHESTGISPYEMMFGTPMRLPTELEDGDIPTTVSKEQMAQIFPQPPEEEQSAKILNLWIKSDRSSTIQHQVTFPEQKRNRHSTLNKDTVEYPYK